MMACTGFWVLLGDERVGLDGRGDRFGRKPLGVDRADDAQVVARGHQVGGKHARHGQRLFGRFVGIAVAQGQVAMRDG